MEPNKWVDDRLAKLNPDDEWQPQVNAAIGRFGGRRAGSRGIGQWPRALSVAIVAAICIMTFPQPRAFAQKVLAPCVEACENFVHSGPMDMHDVHAGVRRLMWTIHSWMGIAPPDFALTDADGSEFRLSNYMGQVVLVNFWASWCRPCQEEIPWFVEFQREHGAQGFAVIGVSVDEDGWKAVRPFMLAKQINYRVGIGDISLPQKYAGSESLPQTLLIDRKGRIQVKYRGITNKAQFEKDIVRILGWN